MGPLVQGSARSRTERIRTSCIFGAAFVAGAVFIFAIVGGLGGALGAGELSVRWRLGFAVTGLFALAATDLLSLGKSTYCPLGLRRQARKTLTQRHGETFVAVVWGLDTGLAVTTFRVAAVTWGALLLSGLGFSVWWAGLAYGLGFAAPFLTLLWTKRTGRSVEANAPGEPGLLSMLKRRAAIQGLSAALLVIAGGIMIAGLGLAV